MKLRYKIGGTFFSLIALTLITTAFSISYTSDCPNSTKTNSNNNANKMLAIVQECYGSTEVLKLAQIDKPVPKANEVLVKVHTAAINPLDWHFMKGSPYIMRFMKGIGAPEEFRTGVDYAGVVEQVGKDVSKFKPGDRVFGARTGAFAEYVTVDEDRGIAHLPQRISFDTAAAIPVAGLTALQAVRDQGLIKPGQKVLINGASGGVGTMAVQLAKSFGAEVTGVCSTRNLEMVKSLGADRVIDYKQSNYTLLNNRYDLIVDMVGNHSILSNLDVLTPNGRLVSVGGDKGDWIAPLKRPIASMIVAPFVDQAVISFVSEVKQKDLEFLINQVYENKMNSQIDREYQLRDIGKAIDYLATRRARGKVLIQVEQQQ
ncbi:NAD(P)-dependent alcohol dehydrogenase [Aliikangiella sp. G2MR2-5]|uniref:NAD(P)-dependent alcohol dehydrogenase n=1 Tax=Aliikangiella sp. G2MR2-5 TaxID=2788943 RepID=UPI001AED5CD1|nr:NAD(P)-dependent alcohol dehydrogenase [Aliikangiella sp. G2MR2-5]